MKSLGYEAILLGMNAEFFFLRQRNTSLGWPVFPLVINFRKDF